MTLKLILAASVVFLAAIVSALVAMVPFWLIWTVCGIGATYAYWLPEVYLRPSLLDCIGLFVVLTIIRTILVPMRKEKAK